MTFGCSKEEVSPQSFSQKMIGTWELRERVDLLHNKNGDWFTLNPPFFTVTLNEDKTYVQSRDTFILETGTYSICLLYTSPSPRDATLSRMPSSA